MGARATDSARVMKFTKVLSGTMVILGIVLTSVFLFSFISLIDFVLVAPKWPILIMKVSYVIPSYMHR